MSPHIKRMTARTMLIGLFPAGESLGSQGSYQTRGQGATGHTGSEAELLQPTGDRGTWLFRAITLL